MQRSLIAAGLAAAFALAGCSKPDATPATEPRAALTVTSAGVQRQTWPQTVEVQGAVAAWQEAQVSARVSGLALVEVAVNVGDRVKQGQRLARFDDRSVRADLAVAEATLAQALANARQETSSRDRTLQLKGSGSVSEQDMEKAHTQADTAAAQVELAKAQLAAQRVRLADCDVLAVDDGVISARSATLGQVAQAGTELFRLIRRERLEWRAELNAEQMAQVAVGQTVRLQLPGGEVMAGSVRQLSPALDGASRLGLAYVDLPAHGKARARQYVSGRIALSRTPALTVPAEAVVLRDGRSSVFKLSDGLVTQVPVQIGRRDAGAIEVVSGVKADDRVAVRGAGFLNDGDRVRLADGGAKP